MEAKYRKTKLACYTTNLCMSIVGNLSPILFLTFRSLYGISFTLLGLLVLINFVTQLIVEPDPWTRLFRSSSVRR